MCLTDDIAIAHGFTPVLSKSRRLVTEGYNSVHCLRRLQLGALAFSFRVRRFRMYSWWSGLCGLKPESCMLFSEVQPLGILAPVQPGYAAVNSGVQRT